eukprot:TRINITY_DN10162_c0_g1_i1.p1 TRINITY_DN10162_c0_g1~~TRINITY_DN10162_c0_g1_i1.p1  ORF type:complete len:143 (-),score=46.13 TRINITY_DN10162_c0_g1_i1:77-505(-)
MAEEKGVVTIYARKAMKNKLLNRLQMVIDVMHPNKSSIPRKTIAAQLCKTFKAKDEKCVYVYGLKTVFGGGKSSGFAFIYDSLEDALDVEPKYSLIRNGLKQKKQTSRKQRHELKNKKKKVRGSKKAKAGTAAGATVKADKA